MHTPERRQTSPASAEQMRERLNPPQRSVLRLLEYFDESTRLRVRHPGFERRQRRPIGRDVERNHRPDPA